MHEKTPCTSHQLQTMMNVTHLIRLPVPEEVDRTVHPPLDHGPAAWVVSLVTPHLHKSVGILWLHQVHATGSVALFQSLQAVLKWT